MTKKREKKSGWQQKLLDQDQSSPTSAAFSRRKYPAEFKTASALRAESSPDGGAYHHRQHPALTEPFGLFPKLGNTLAASKRDSKQRVPDALSTISVAFPAPAPPAPQAAELPVHGFSLRVFPQSCFQGLVWLGTSPPAPLTALARHHSQHQPWLAQTLLLQPCVGGEGFTAALLQIFIRVITGGQERGDKHT